MSSAPETLRALVERRFVALAVLLVLAVHAISLGHGFVDFDDDAIFLRHPVITRTDPAVVLPALFDLDRPDDFRPMRDLSHWADLLVHHHTPFWSHLHHLAVLSLVVVATGAFLRRIDRGGLFGLVVLLAAYTHPVQVEVIAWISGRKDLLASVFFFAALTAFLRFLRSPQRAHAINWAAATLSLVALGMMSKGHVIVAPGVLLMLWLHERWRAPTTIARPPRAVVALLGVLTLGCVISAPRVAGGHVVLPEAYRETVRYALTLGDRIQLPLRYVINLVRPTELNHIYLTPPLDPLHDVMTVASALLTLALVALGLHWLRRRDPRAPLLAIVAGLMLPFMHFKPGVVYMADRYLFLPMPFIALLAVDGIDRLMTRRAVSSQVRATAAAVVLALAALLSVGEHAAWHDPITLWTRMTRVYPESAWGYDRLGRAYYYAGRYSEAGGAWIAAAEREPGVSKHLNNAAVAAMALGEDAAAVGLLRRALAIDPDDPQARGNLQKLGQPVIDRR
ncbi:MAG: hypothetical protein H6701_17235 [Myxococcales bacterium]|nr:hypothetical protein [Myxococcales bacterium]